jgi:alkanesulfonate monooxygenase SsuD/methylene tetrahydromethanopterin reductase-like flavin-dependent oxidoreductase (luciferase family)
VDLVELAVLAEGHGWDGVFLWDHVLYHHPQWGVVNPVAVLGAIAARTSRIRLGTPMTALPRRRAQIVARETATLDVLSGGRLVFGAGLGSMDAEYAAFGEDPDLRVRAARLDESLATLVALWSGEPVSVRGEHVTVDGVSMLPTPVQRQGGQRPRIPVWCAGRWPTRAGFRRAARWDGTLATFAGYGRETPVPVEAFAAVAGFIAAERGTLAGFDLALEGWTEPGWAAATIEPYAAAGLTWWVEAMGWWRGGLTTARERIAAGPA